MRNPNRIESFMREMGDLWRENFPDWRFGQLMYNFFARLGDPFYYEEEELLVAFQAFCANQDPKEAIRKLREPKIKLGEEKLKRLIADMEKWNNTKWDDMSEIDGQ